MVQVLSSRGIHFDFPVSVVGDQSVLRQGLSGQAAHLSSAPAFPWFPWVFWELWWSEWSRSCLGEGAGVRGGCCLRLGCPSQGSLLLAPVWLSHTYPCRGLFWVFLKKGVFISCLLSGNAATTMSSGQRPVVKPPYFWGDHRANNVQTSFPLTNLL